MCEMVFLHLMLLLVLVMELVLTLLDVRVFSLGAGGAA